MILTQCPVCAAPLPDLTAKQCSRCKTRYCGRACQEQHWKEGGHDKLCKQIKRSGGAEQYNGNKKYAEAVAAAVEKCADNTKGQTCFICMQALHWKTKEGLVRGCSCRGTAGFAHVSCLAEQAKILFAEAEENNLGVDTWNERWPRWEHCSLCGQNYHGAVRCALGWACWKTYVGRPERDWPRRLAMNQLGCGLSEAGHHEDSLSVREAELSMERRLGAPKESILATQGNLASSYARLKRLEEAQNLYRDVYFGQLKLYGAEDRQTLISASNYANTLVQLQHFEEAKALLRKAMPVARRVLGENHELTLKMRSLYAQSLYADNGATLDNLREAVSTLEDLERTARRVLGCAHPTVKEIMVRLRDARATLAAREGDGVSSVCEAVAAANLRTAA